MSECVTVIVHHLLYGELTDDDLPILRRVGHLVGAPHLGVGQSAKHKHNQSWYIFDVEGVLVFVPMAVAHTGGSWSTVISRSGAARQKLKVLGVQLVFDCVLSPRREKSVSKRTPPLH